MIYPRCGTCKHFDTTNPVGSCLPPEYEYAVAWPGLCQLAEGPFNPGNSDTLPSPSRLAITIDGSTYTSSLLVTPDFGCVMHSDLHPEIS